MFKYILQRLLRSAATLLIVISAVFLLLRGMPIEGYFANFEKLTDEQIQNALHQMGLDLPAGVQLLNFLQNLLRGDLGTSRVYRANVPVAEILAAKLPVSMRLGSMSLGLSLVCGLALGTLMARRKGSIADAAGTAFIVFVQAVPAAVYFLFLQLFASHTLKLPLLFNAQNPLSWLMPVFSLSLTSTAHYAMWLRRYLLDQSTMDYVLLARATGYSEKEIFKKQLFRSAFVPLAQYLPTSFLNTLVGSIYIEALYGIPGMGGLLVDVIKKQDNAMVQGIVLIYAGAGVLGLLLGDAAMALLDPRILLSRGKDTV